MNNFLLMGRLTRDPELRRTQSGIAVTSFTLAVDRTYMPKGATKRETDFFDCTAWRSTAELIATYFSKGRMCAVTGRVEFRNWTDEEGVNHRKPEVVVENVYFTGDKRHGDTERSCSTNNATPAVTYERLDDTDSDLPF